MWPEYNRHGDVVSRYWERPHAERPDFQFVLCDDEERVLAQGHSLPVSWDGTIDGLPDGVDGAIVGGFDDDGADTLCAMAIEIAPARQGSGLSRVMVEAMAGIARQHGFEAPIAPVRPSCKERYPLIPIERYATWRRDDRLPFDPWMRVHERLGGEILKPEPRSLRITGTVSEWETWTRLAFPESGEYVFPHGLATVAIDHEHDVGRYWEPNVWMCHRGG
ncbi:MAG: N-acetyltransferase [Actinomycetota bacterium]|nr:N-acetyltransferase [Actinomycetota bacterium]